MRRGDVILMLPLFILVAAGRAVPQSPTEPAAAVPWVDSPTAGVGELVAATLSRQGEPDLGTPWDGGDAVAIVDAAAVDDESTSVETPVEQPFERPALSGARSFRMAVPFRTQKDGGPYQGSNCGPATLGMVLE